MPFVTVVLRLLPEQPWKGNLREIFAKRYERYLDKCELCVTNSRVTKNKILVIEDDADMVFLLRRLLEGAGYHLTAAADGKCGLEVFEEIAPDLVILDVNLPLLDGLDVCRRLRSSSMVPILMLSCHREDYDKVVGLETGADDYLGKPFNPSELLARVHALLRRARAFGEPTELRIGDLCLDPSSHEVTREGALLSLTPIEFSLLEELMRRSGLTLSRAELLRAIWGGEFQGQTRTVDTHIRNLRLKLPESSRIRIESVRGVGFKLVEESLPLEPC